MTSKIDKEKLMQSKMTILFHAGNKVFAPIVDIDKMDAIRYIAVHSVDSLVEVEAEVMIKEEEE